MTPKEKADELVNRFAKLPEEGTLMWYLSFEIAKKCAIIAVDEMLNNAGFIWGGRDAETGLSARDEYRKYWNEVKQEIEKL